MKILLKISLFIFGFLTLSNAQLPRIDLMPVPAEISLTDAVYNLDSSFTILVKGEEKERINKAATRFLRRLSGRTGLFFSQDFITEKTIAESPALIIQIIKKGELELFTDESYKLEVTESQVTLNAETDLGAMHGLETLLQLLIVNNDSYAFNGVKINDYPRFPWRGLMIDASRHFMPLEVIKKNLDGMAAVKLNVFHWHLSDDQGFRVESKVYPKLHLKGSDGFYYTQNQVKEIVDYAAERGIRVVPEFDVPGHATAMTFAYPELGSGPQPEEIERKWGIFYPALNPASEFTYTFLDNLFKEMAGLFPDKYFHIGGDELEHGDYHEAKHWNENNEIQAFKKEHGIKDNSALQAYFNSRLLKSLTKYGKILIGWDEILHENMPVNIVIQSWRGKESMESAAKNGYQSILSNGYYIDLMLPASDHYLNDPLPQDTNLNDEQKKLILGGEATMWAEFVSPETIDSRIWPRTAAIAERLWSSQNISDVDDMYRRLDIVSFQLEELGLQHIKNYDMMLRRLTGNKSTDALKVLTDVVEPLKRYQRGQKRDFTSYSPLTRVMDTARPESGTARLFEKLVDTYLSDKLQKSIEIEIRSWLELWQMNHKKLQETIKQSPILKEIEPLSQNLSAIAQAGLEALTMLEKNSAAEKTWLSGSKQIIEKAGQSYGQVELHVISAIEKLVNAAGK